ncbi:olfactory receptor 14J1-like [Polyodon spathula]|uniref:olfactory receptor 14J1-like n=1 Tax=Polyodon spathula TaxID=7913 RepID=UPI001B7DBCC1|nr:olfactory receptor 14J1-like [Polyodon spathula]
MEKCNGTGSLWYEQITTELFFKIKLVITIITCLVNLLLSLPLLFVITRNPSVQRKLRYVILANLLICDNLQLLLGTVHFSTCFSLLHCSLINCFIYIILSFNFCIVEVFFTTAFSVDRCIAIKWPLQYETIFSSGRKKTIVAAIWLLAMLLTLVTLFEALNKLTMNVPIERCRLFIIAPCFSDPGILEGYSTFMSAFLFLSSYICILGCLLLLCWDIRLFLKTRRAWVTLVMQVLQLIFYSAPLLIDIFLFKNLKHKDDIDITIVALFNLGISLVPLVYGYRSVELQGLLWQLLPLSRNKIQPVSC